MTNEDKDNIKYENKSLAEFNKFKIKIKAKANKKSSNCLKAVSDLAEGTAHEKEEAHRDLYYILIDNIADEDLLVTLDTDYAEQGYNALKYMEGLHSAGTNEPKLKESAKKYKELCLKLAESKTAGELRGVINQMQALRKELSGSDREITKNQFISDVCDAVSDMSPDHRREVRDEVKSLTDKKLAKDETSIVSMLEGVMTTMTLNNNREREQAQQQAFAAQQQQVLAAMQDPGGLAAMLAQMNVGQAYGTTWQDPCGKCGVPHPGNPEECHAWLLSQGKDVPDWDKKDARAQERIRSRADDITRLGPWEQRQNGGKGKGKGRGGGGGRGGRGRGGNVNQALLAMMLAAQMPRGAQQCEITVPSARVFALPPMGVAMGVRMVMDSGNLSNSHLICDKTLFRDYSESVQSIPVMVANKNIEWTEGGGTCDVLCIDDQGRVLGRLVLPNCKYIDPSRFSVNLISVKRAWDDGIRIRFEDTNAIIARDGSTLIPFSPDDYTMRVVATPTDTNHITIGECYRSIISRGKHGPTHISTKKLTDNQSAMMKLWSARLNDPPPKVLRQLPNIVKGAPDLLQQADQHNAFSDARMLANGPRHPAPMRSDHIATKPGELTSFDHWSAPCTSVFGFTGIIAGVDNYSGHMRIMLVANKTACPQAVRRYYLLAKRDGVDIAPGSIAYSDNEPIFKSFKLAAVADELGLLQRYSAEYEPWGNGGVESIFRWLPWEMRKMHERGKAPQTLWVFSALHGERILNARRARNGKSIDELWSKRPTDISHLKVLFCRATARKPIPWRGGKLDAQKLDGVYCGESPSRAGSMILTAKHGLVCSTNCDYIEDEFPFATGFEFEWPSMGGGAPRELSRLGMGQPHAGGGGGGGPAGDDDDSDNDDGDSGDFDIDDNEDDNNYTPTSDDPTDESGSASGPYGPKSSLATESDDDNDGAVVLPDGTVVHDESDEGRLDDEDPERSSCTTPSQSPSQLPDSEVCTRSQALHTHLPDLTLQRIQAHIDSLLGKQSTGIAASTFVPGVGFIALSAEDPCASEWVPPPYFDVSKIRDPELRARWQQADKKEVDGLLKERECAREELYDDVMKADPNVKIIGSLNTRKIKRDGQFKSRCCSRGDHMQQYVHYNRSHSPTIMHVSERFLFAFGCMTGMMFAGGDFSQAFANAALDEDEQYYMWPPPGARQYDDQGRRLVWKVVKSLYGGKNAGRNWFKLLRKWLKSYGFKQCPTEPCIFSRRSAGHTIIIGVYVDDLLVLYDDKTQFETLAADIKRDFDFTIQSPLREMCGIEVSVTPGSVTLTLTGHIIEMANRFLRDDKTRKTVRVPCSAGLDKLVDAAMDNKHLRDVDPVVRQEYQEMVGSLLYVAVVLRPDIAYSVGMLSRAMSAPTPELLEAARDVVRYLYDTRELGLRYARQASSDKMRGQADSDWGVGASISAYVFFMCGCAISYLSKKQPTIAMSSTEAEIYAASLAGLEAVFLRSLLEMLKPDAITGPTIIDVDNKGAVDMSEDYIANSRNRHFTRRHLKVRELVEDGVVQLKSIPTDDNVSDIMTKPLSVRRFEKLRRMLLNM